MPRPKGSKNKPKPTLEPFSYTLEQRMELIANLIVEVIIEDRQKGSPLLKKIEAENKEAAAST